MAERTKQARMKGEGRTVSINVRLTEAQHDYLTRAAAARHLSINAAMQLAVESLAVWRDAPVLVGAWHAYIDRCEHIAASRPFNLRESLLDDGIPDPSPRERAGRLILDYGIADGQRAARAEIERIIAVHGDADELTYWQDVELMLRSA